MEKNMKNMHSDVRCEGLGKPREMRSKKKFLILISYLEPSVSYFTLT